MQSPAACAALIVCQQCCSKPRHLFSRLLPESRVHAPAWSRKLASVPREATIVQCSHSILDRCGWRLLVSAVVEVSSYRSLARPRAAQHRCGSEKQ